MRKIENDCCGCSVPAYPCIGSSCPLTHAVHYYCDKCGEEIDPDYLYRADGDDLCEDCLLSLFKINPEDDE